MIYPHALKKFLPNSRNCGFLAALGTDVEKYSPENQVNNGS